MSLFFILINSDLGGEKEIEKEIKKTLNKDTDFEFVPCYGVYDAVVKVNDKNEDPRSLQDKLKAIPKVHSIMILTVC